MVFLEAASSASFRFNISPNLFDISSATFLSQCEKAEPLLQNRSIPRRT